MIKNIFLLAVITAMTALLVGCNVKANAHSLVESVTESTTESNGTGGFIGILVGEKWLLSKNLLGYRQTGKTGGKLR